MDVTLECMYCITGKADSLFSRYETDAARKLAFMREVFGIMSRSAPHDTAPYLMAQVMRTLNRELELGDIYRDLKKEYNRRLVAMEPEITARIDAADDRFMAALKYAMIGNYIDFGAMDDVDTEQLRTLVAGAPGEAINREEYARFRGELEHAARIVYLIDNAGEMVFDKLFIRVIGETYPNLEMDAVVRGAPILNDATMVEARETGLCDVVNVVSNGTDIPGTDLARINASTRTLMEKADLMIAKGQGNFETLHGCGLNIYYIFLCKCALFTERFGLERFKGVFANERNIREVMAEAGPAG